MPVVSRSDCTQTNVKEYYTFSKAANVVGFTTAIDRINLQFQACNCQHTQKRELKTY